VAVGREQYLWENQILFKPYADPVKQASERLNKESWKPFEQPQLPMVFLRSAPVDQEELARRMAAEKGIRTGLVCAIRALEPSPHFGTPRYTDHPACAALSGAVSLPNPCGVGVDACAHPDVVSF